MALLPVLDPYADAATYGSTQNLDDSLYDHSALRTITFSGATGAFGVGETVTFLPSGATGIVSSWNAGSLTLSYFLISPQLTPTALGELTAALISIIDGSVLEPAIGDDASSTSGAGTSATAVDHGGDTFLLDGSTGLYIQNFGSSAVTVLATSSRACTDGVVHTDRLVVGAGKRDRFGPLSKVRFADPHTGLMAVRYLGSLANADVGVVPVRTVPRP